MSTYRSRATSSESMLDELFGTSGLEGDLPPAEPDPGFPLRPFAAAMPMDDLTVTEPRTDESPADAGLCVCGATGAPALHPML